MFEGECSTNLPVSASIGLDANAWAVVVVQLVERSLLTPEIRGLNPAIGNLIYYLSTVL